MSYNSNNNKNINELPYWYSDPQIRRTINSYEVLHVDLNNCTDEIIQTAREEVCPLLFNHQTIQPFRHLLSNHGHTEASQFIAFVNLHYEKIRTSSKRQEYNHQVCYSIHMYYVHLGYIYPFCVCAFWLHIYM